MRAVLGMILVTALVVAGAWWVQHLAGNISLTIAGLTVEAPISVAVLALLIFAALLAGLYRVLHWLFTLHHAVRRFGGRRGARKGEAAVTEALVALAAREGDDAVRAAARARRYLGDSPQTLVLAATAANAAGEPAEAEKIYEILAARKDSAFLGLRGLMTQAMARQDWARANDLAAQAEKSHPGSAWLRAERSDLATRTGDWEEALLLTRDHAPHAALAAAAAIAEKDPVRGLKLAKGAYKRDPSLAAAALAYASRLRDAGREKLAQDVLHDTWARAPNPDIAAASLQSAPDRLAALKLGQALVSGAPESAETHLLLGRLNLEAGVIPEALRHAEAAEHAGLKQRRVYTLFADIAAAGGLDPDQSARVQAARGRAVTAEPDPVWRCGACFTQHDAWSAACPNCHSAGRIVWGAPQAGVTQVLRAAE
jgi:HemY protein